MHAYVRATNRLPCAVQLHYAVNDGEKQTVRIEPGDEAIFVTPQTEEPLIYTSPQVRGGELFGVHLPLEGDLGYPLGPNVTTHESFDAGLPIGNLSAQSKAAAAVIDLPEGAAVEILGAEALEPANAISGGE
ncbi:MAG: hypothetical protein ACFB21_15310 [Opitutales bacterium]